MAKTLHVQSANIGNRSTHCGSVIGSLNAYKLDENAQAMHLPSLLEASTGS